MNTQIQSELKGFANESEILQIQSSIQSLNDTIHSIEAEIAMLSIVPSEPSLSPINVTGNQVSVIICEPSSFYPDTFEMYFEEISPTPTNGFQPVGNYTTLPPGAQVWINSTYVFTIPNGLTCTPSGLSTPLTYNGQTIPTRGRFYFVSLKTGLESNIGDFYVT